MPTTFKSFVDGWTEFIGTSISGLLLTLATVVFFYNIVRFILKRSSGDAKGLDDAKNNLGWSLLGLIVMFSIWGIVNFFQVGFGIQGKDSIVAPSVRVNGSNSSSASSVSKTPIGGSCSNSTQCVSGYCAGGVCMSVDRQTRGGL